MKNARTRNRINRLVIFQISNLCNDCFDDMRRSLGGVAFSEYLKVSNGIRRSIALKENTVKEIMEIYAER